MNLPNVASTQRPAGDLRRRVLIQAASTFLQSSTSPSSEIHYRPSPVSTLLWTALVAIACLASFASAAQIETGSGVDQVSRSGAAASYAPVFSADGQYVGFVSLAPNLTTNEVRSRFFNVYVRDLIASNTALVSVTSAGNGGNGHSLIPVLSSNGLTVAFESEASNLAGIDTNGMSDIYVRNVASHRTELVSVNATGSASGNGRSWNPQISADGRFVVFESLASNLVTNDFNGTNDVFIRDLETGVTSLISVNADGTASADGPSDSPSISADGRTVAFVSRGANLVTGATNRLGEVYVRDVVGGSTKWAVASHLPSTRDPATLAFSASQPVLSADGRFVAFKTQAGQIARFDTQRETNSVVTSFPQSQPPAVFRFDDNPRLGGRSGALPTPDIALTPDGRYLTFVSGPNVVPSNTVFRTDFESFVTNVVYQPPAGGLGDAYSTNQFTRVEIVSTAVGTNLPATGRSVYAGLSADGQRVLFLSDSTNLVSQPSDGSVQLYWRDLAGGDVRLLSTNRSGAIGAGLDGVIPAMDRQCLQVAYETVEVLVAGDFNNTSDVFVRDVATGETSLISEHTPGHPSLVLGGPSYVRPDSLSADGRWLALQSLDRQSLNHEPSRNYVVWLRDLFSGTNYYIHPAGYPFSRDAVISGDGRYFAYVRSAPPNYGRPALVRLDRLSGRTVEIPVVIQGFDTTVGGRVPNSAMSRDGRNLAYRQSTNGNLYVYDCLLETNLLATTRPDGVTQVSGSHWDPIFSPDGQWLAFASTSTELTTNAQPGLHVRNLVDGVPVWLTDSLGQSGITNGFAFSGDSRWIAYVRTNHVLLRNLGENSAETVISPNGSHPAISSDARYVAYATPVDGTGIPNIVRLDRQTGELNLISRSRAGSGGGNGPSATPVITPDGRFVVFVSKANDLVDNDTNGQSDVFVRDTLLGTTLLASLNKTGTGSGNGPSSRPILGADGRTVMFHSFAGDLVEGDYNDRRDVFLLRLGATDSDGDGLDDDWELAYFNTLDRDGSGDFDNDGVSDRAEFLAGTAPTNDTSILRVLTLSSAGGSGVTVLWSAVPGRSYRVQFKRSIDDANWQELPALVTASATTASAIDAGATGPHRFYRVVLAP